MKTMTNDRKLIWSIGFLTLIFAGCAASGCKKVVDVEKAKQNPNDVLFASFANSLTLRSYRIEAVHKNSINLESTILERVEPDRWRITTSIDNIQKDDPPYPSQKIEIGKDSYFKGGDTEWYKHGTGYGIGNGPVVSRKELGFFTHGKFTQAILHKAKVEYAGEAVLDGMNCAVFEYNAPGEFLASFKSGTEPKYRVWVSIVDGLVRKMTLEGLWDIGDEPITETLTFSYDEKSIKIEPPI